MPVPHSASHQRITANAVAQLRGKTKAPRFYTAGSPSPQFPISAIYCVTACAFFSITLYVYENGSIYNTGENQELFVDDSGQAENVQVITFPAGSLIRANIYSFSLDGGTIIVYPA